MEITRTEGKGEVYKAGQKIAEVRYEITFQIDHSGPVADERITIQFVPADALAGQFGNSERLTLHLQDGRKQDFSVVTLAGSCEPIGDPYS